MCRSGHVLAAIGLLVFLTNASSLSLDDMISRNQALHLGGYKKLLSTMGGFSGSRKLQQAGSILDLGLIVASRDGDTSEVRRLLNAGADPNFITSDGRFSPLTAAAARNQASVVRLLVQGGASVGLEASGLTPLELAASLGSTEAARALVAAGANPNSVMLLAATFNEDSVLLVLIQGGGDVNLENDRGFTPLLLAAFLGNEESIAVLVNNGADVTSTGGLDLTPLEALCQCIFSEEPDEERCQFQKCDSPSRMISLLS